MNIIFGTKEADLLRTRYVILELDTVTIKSSNPITMYCAVENMPIDEISMLAHLKDLHNNLMTEYKKKNWEFCEQAISHLLGRWGKELDSFYEILSQRIVIFKENDPGEDWTGIVAK